MKADILEYNGYHSKIEVDMDSMCLYGKIEGISDYVDFHADSLADIEREFHEAVDDYLEFCAEQGKQPDKEYKGTFNVRISPELHKALAIISLRNNDSLNATVEKALDTYVKKA